MTSCRKHQLVSIIAAIAIGLVILASPAAAAPAQSGNAEDQSTNAEDKADNANQGTKQRTGRFELQTDKLPSITQGDTAWVALSWYAGGDDAENVRVTATANKGATVGYPANTIDHSGPYGETGISSGGIDFTALKITVPADANGNVKVEVTVTWTEGGTSMSDNYTVHAHTSQYQGQDLDVLTTNVTVDPVAGGWVGMEFAGLAPSLTDFQLTISGPAGLAIEYPLGTHTSLHANSTLEDGETDIARFYVAPTLLGTPSVQVQYQISYMGGAGPVVSNGTLDIMLSA